MKIAAVLFLGLLAYSMADTGDEDGTSGVAGAPLQAKQAPVSSQSVQSARFVQPSSQGVGATRRRTSFGNPQLVRIIRLMVILNVINSFTTTTKAPDTTMPDTTAPLNTTAGTTAAAATTTAVNPFSGWIPNGNCFYQMQTSSVTAVVAQASCTTKGAHLAAIGFVGLDSPERSALITKVMGDSVTFWIDARANEVPANSGTMQTGTDSYAVLGATDRPSNDGITLAKGVSGSGNNLCGRFDATDKNRLIFESCTVAVARYLCEFCGSV